MGGDLCNINLTGLSSEEKEKLRVKLVERLKKLEVNRKVSGELDIMKDEMEKAKCHNLLHKIELQHRLFDEIKEIREKERLAGNLNYINKYVKEKQIQEDRSIYEKDGKRRQDETESRLKAKKNDEMDEKVLEKINKIHKCETENRLLEDKKNLALEEEQARLINKVHRLEVEDKLVRNMIDVEKEKELDMIVSQMHNGTPVEVCIDTLESEKY